MAPPMESRFAKKFTRFAFSLESFCISPDAVAQALKLKLGCTTAVLKLPGNNVKDMEVLLQGHCVNEVLEYLNDVYCIDRQWVELKLKDPKPR